MPPPLGRSVGRVMIRGDRRSSCFIRPRQRIAKSPQIIGQTLMVPRQLLHDGLPIVTTQQPPMDKNDGTAPEARSAEIVMVGNGTDVNRGHGKYPIPPDSIQTMVVHNKPFNPNRDCLEQARDQVALPNQISRLGAESTGGSRQSLKNILGGYLGTQFRGGKMGLRENTKGLPCTC